MLSVALESMDRFRQASLAGAGTGKLPHIPIAKAPSPDAKASVIEEVEYTHWSIFTDVTNTQANLDGTSNGLSDFNYSILQSILGVEYAFTPTITAGAVFGYGRSSLYNFEYANAGINSNNYSAALFGVYKPGHFTFTGLLGYTSFSYKYMRLMPRSQMSLSLEASPSSGRTEGATSLASARLLSSPSTTAGRSSAEPNGQTGATEPKSRTAAAFAILGSSFAVAHIAFAFHETDRPRWKMAVELHSSLESDYKVILKPFFDLLSFIGLEKADDNAFDVRVVSIGPCVDIVPSDRSKTWLNIGLISSTWCVTRMIVGPRKLWPKRSTNVKK